jgi:cytokinin dehydrogenase
MNSPSVIKGPPQKVRRIIEGWILSDLSIFRNAMDSERLTAALMRRISGKVCLDHESLAAASWDFGRVAECRPSIVVWPVNTDDVVAIVQIAREARTTLAIRGAGHSQGGQALSRGGIVIHTEQLCRIDAFNATEGTITAEAGMLWNDLVNTVMQHSLLPVVMTDHLKVTLGGTLAIGGVGPASFRSGAQIDSCEGLEVVLGTGEVVWLSATQQPRLFEHVLGGLGQFGVVTKVRLRLRTAPRRIRSYYLVYDQVDTLLRDARLLMRREDVHLLSGYALPKPSPVAGSSYGFVLTASTEIDDTSSHGALSIVEGTDPRTSSYEVMTMRDCLARLDSTFASYRRSAEHNVVRPWVEHFLPISAVPQFVEFAAKQFPTVPLLIWPMQTASFRRTMLRLPAVEEVALVGILCWQQSSELPKVLPRLKKVDTQGVMLGGTRYLSGWLEFDRERWRQHFGAERWQEIIGLQRQCDPDNLFRFWERTAN